MKSLFLFVTILSVSIFSAQSKNIYVQYSVKLHDEEILAKADPDFRGLFVDAMSSANRMLFGLIINNSGSKFYQIPLLGTSEDDKIRTSTIFIGFSGEIYQFEEYTYSESNTFGKDILVKEVLKDNWQLHSETKMIDNFLCYKATNIHRVKNGSNKIFNHPVIAWYCPELPFPYGPNGYNNLPGLILQLQVRNVVFAAKQIDLNSDLDFDSSFLKKAKTMTLDELNAKIEDEMQQLKNSVKH
jgi:GLPGLI family protein